MAVKCGSGLRPAAHSAKRRFLNCLETSLTPSSTLPAKLRLKTGLAEPKRHGSEARMGPAAGSP